MAKQSNVKRNQASRATLSKTICLVSESSQKLYKRHYKDVSIKAHHIGFILRVNGFTEFADQAEVVISELINAAQKDMQGEIAQMTQLRKDRGIDVTPNYTNVYETEAEITSPTGGQYLSLIEQLDEFLKMVDSLYLCGELTGDQRVQASYKWESRLRKLAMRLRDLSQKLEKHTKSVASQKKSSEESHDSDVVDAEAPKKKKAPVKDKVAAKQEALVEATAAV